MAQRGDALLEELDAMSEEFSRRFGLRPASNGLRGWLPPVDVWETPTELVIELDVPGWPAERVARTLRLGQEPGSPEALDLLEDPLGEAAYFDVLSRVAAAQVAPLLLELSEREREIVERRADGASLRDVGRELGVSGERVRVVEERALAKVRAAALDGEGDPVRQAAS